MSEFDTLKNMLDRIDAKYTIDTEEEIMDENSCHLFRTDFICIPAMQNEFLILGFDEDGECVYMDAATDWEDYLKRREAHEAV